jgi:hypothetical protein
MKHFETVKMQIDNYCTMVLSRSLINWKRVAKQIRFEVANLRALFPRRADYNLFMCAPSALHRAKTLAEITIQERSPVLLSDDFLMIFICVRRLRARRPTLI